MADTNDRNAASATTTESRIRALLIGARPRRTILRIAVMIVAAVVAFGYILIPVRGEGPSMQPTLDDGQLVFVNTLAYWRSAPARGDIVALSLAGRHVVYIKRVVGLPGERVRIDGGTVYVNDEPLDEAYVARRSAWNVRELGLGADEYLFIGDNRGMSMRLHDFGKGRRDRVIGRVIYW